jgi:hypothetical protein
MKNSQSGPKRHRCHLQKDISAHYRSLLQREMPIDPQAPKMETSQAALSTLRSKMINIALKHGKSYKRWQKVVTILLEKVPGPSTPSHTPV